MNHTITPVLTKVSRTGYFGMETILKIGKMINGTPNANGNMADHVARYCFQRAGGFDFSVSETNKKSKPLLI